MKREIRSHAPRRGANRITARTSAHLAGMVSPVAGFFVAKARRLRVKADSQGSDKNIAKRRNSPRSSRWWQSNRRCQFPSGSFRWLSPVAPNAFQKPARVCSHSETISRNFVFASLPANLGFFSSAARWNDADSFERWRIRLRVRIVQHERQACRRVSASERS